MKYPTKRKRLLAIVDTYMALHCKSAVTMEEVAAWAQSEGLYPVPTRGDPKDECEEWEKRLEQKGV
jgi:hypothetical protein